VGDDTWSALDGAGPCDAGDDGVVGVGFVEGFFVSDSVLDDNESCVGACYGLEERRDGEWLDGFVGADNVVEGCVDGFGRAFVDWYDR
jgi:hypothetical protein